MGMARAPRLHALDVRLETGPVKGSMVLTKMLISWL